MTLSRQLRHKSRTEALTRVYKLERTVDALLEENERLRRELRSALGRTKSADPKAGACNCDGCALRP